MIIMRRDVCYDVAALGILCARSSQCGGERYNLDIVVKIITYRQEG